MTDDAFNAGWDAALAHIKERILAAMASECYGHDTGDLYQRIVEAVEGCFDNPGGEKSV
jgi:hypothetical protein